MKLIKKIIRVILIGLVLLFLAVLGIVFYPADPYQPPERVQKDESAYRLDEKTGWYRFEDGSHRLLAHGPEQGLMMYRFGLIRRHLARTLFIPESDRTLKSASSDKSSRLTFFDPDTGSSISARLTGNDGVERTIKWTDDQGYNVQEVRFRNEQTELSGLLFMPDGEGPFPAVVFIHGSGVSNRDRFWYLTPANHLAKRGVAVLLPDKRGCGKSAGQWHTASFDDLAGDALAAIEFLDRQNGIDPRRIGLAGFSEGGWIAPLAAGKSSQVAFLITISGSAAKPSRQLNYELRNKIHNAGAPKLIASMIAPLFARRAKMPRTLWWELNGKFNPIPFWQSLKTPTLMIFGEADQNVDVNRSLRLLKEAGVRDRLSFRTLVLPGLAHGLIRQDSDWLDPEYLKAMTTFVKSQN